MPEDRIEQGTLLTAIWTVSTMVSLPVGNGFLLRGIEHASGMLPDALGDLVSDDGRVLEDVLDEVVDVAEAEGVLEIHDDGHLKYGMSRLTEKQVDTILVRHGLSRSTARDVGRRMFEGCTKGHPVLRGDDTRASVTPSLFG